MSRTIIRKIAFILLVITVALTLPLIGCKSRMYVVGVAEGSNSELYICGNKSWGYTGFKGIRCASYKGFDSLLQDMGHGKVDAIVVDSKPTAAELAKWNLKLVNASFVTNYVIPVRPVLKESINDIISESKEEINGIIKKYSDEKYTPDVKNFSNYTKLVEQSKTSVSDGKLVVSMNIGRKTTMGVAEKQRWVSYKPFRYLSSDIVETDNESTSGAKIYVGIDLELAKLFADKLGKQLVIKMKTDYKQSVEAVLNGEADICISNIAEKMLSEEFKDNTNGLVYSVKYADREHYLLVKPDYTYFDDAKDSDNLVKLLSAAQGVHK